MLLICKKPNTIIQCSIGAINVAPPTPRMYVKELDMALFLGRPKIEHFAPGWGYPHNYRFAGEGRRSIYLLYREQIYVGDERNYVPCTPAKSLLADTKICFTGNCDGTKTFYQGFAALHGATPVSASKDADILVSSIPFENKGEWTSKMKAALNKGVPIINEKQFFDLAQGVILATICGEQ